MSTHRFPPALSERPANRDAAALLERHQKELLRYVSGKLGPDGGALVSDIWQEVVIAAHRHRFEEAPIEDPLNWLRRIASNKIADHWRRTIRGREADARWLEDEQITPSPCPFEWVLHQSRRETVREVLSLLDEDDRRLLREKYLAGRTTGEIARIEGVGEKIIEHRLAAARASFREKMAREL